ncbi:AI-2E family transporter [Chitinophagaceae bacterium 26-R-25]|nr:AI-2E family transporter [Chitinophagaceae bacterium 26-R-25]
MDQIKLPLYVKLSLVSLLLALWLYGLFVGQYLLLPLGFAVLIAILLRPLEARLIKWKIPRVPAILLSILIAVIVLGGVMFFISSQVQNFIQDLPTIKKNINTLVSKVQQWIRQQLHVSQHQQQQVVAQAKEKATGEIGTVAGGALSIIGSSLSNITLIPIYTFLFMYYRELLRTFVVRLFHKKHNDKVVEVISEVRFIIQHYIAGLLLENSCVAVLNAIGLFIIGAPYALLLSIIGAILNLIPYIGGLIAVFLISFITYTNTGEVSKLIWAIVIFLVVQFIDNNFIYPRIIGSKVKLNALVCIVGVIVAGSLAGIGGMFLSIPFIAICKTIFDRVDELKPWGMLLGDDFAALHEPRKRKKIEEQDKN